MTARTRLWLVTLFGAAFVIVVVAASLGLGITYDVESLKPRLVSAIRQATGREVAIDGTLRLGLSLRPTLEANHLTLANEAGFGPGPIIALDRIDLRLALLPLLRRKIEVEELDLVHPVVALEIDGAGHGNWVSSRPTDAQPPSSPAAPKPASVEVRSSPSLHIRVVRVTRGTVAFRDARTGASANVADVDLTATQDAPDSPIRIDAHATRAGIPIAVAGEASFKDGRVDKFNATITAADARLAVAGAPPLLHLDAQIPDLARLSPVIGTVLPSLSSLTARTDLAVADNRAITDAFDLRSFSLASPAGEVTGDATISLTSPVAIKANLVARAVDVSRLFTGLSVPSPDHGPPAVGGPSGTASAPVATAPVAAHEWVIPDRPLPLAVLRNLDADLTISLTDTKIGTVIVPKAATHAVLSDGRLTLDPVALELPAGRVDGSAGLAANGAATLRLAAPSLALQPLLAALDQPDGVSGVVGVRADLRSQGASPRALAAAVSGKIGVALANAEIDNRLLIALLSRLAPEAGLLDLARKPDRSAVRCIALRADFTDGLGDVRALLLDTVPLRLTGTGSIDLRQETLALRLQPLVRMGGSGIAVPVNVRGGFRAVRTEVDASAGSRDKALAGIVMGALGADRLIAGAGQSDGCADQLKLARFDQSGPSPPALPPPDAAKSKPPNLNTLLKQLLR